MSCVQYVNDELHIEGLSLKQIAEKYGTPLYVYSRASIEKNWRSFSQGFGNTPHLNCYSVKANSNIAILHLLAQLNAGFDIVSGGELKRVLEAKGDPSKIIFSGVGKLKSEIEQAIDNDIYCFNVESAAELSLLHQLAQSRKKILNIALRVNPNINPHTHTHIITGSKVNKFGIEIDEILPLCQEIKSSQHLRMIGLACHIGSQITDLSPLLRAVDKLITLYEQIQKIGIELKDINVGGGLGITYHNENPPEPLEYINALQQKFKNLPVRIITEPGRAIIGNAGLLLTRIEYIKHTHFKNFLIVDAGMNDYVRPALYGAWQRIKCVTRNNLPEKVYDIAGPLCESADFLGKDRSLAVTTGDLLTIESAGAYGFSMSSNYNSRPRIAEVLVDGNQAHLIRRREKIEELYAAENMVEFTV